MLEARSLANLTVVQNTDCVHVSQAVSAALNGVAEGCHTVERARLGFNVSSSHGAPQPRHPSSPGSASAHQPARPPVDHIVRHRPCRSWESALKIEMLESLGCSYLRHVKKCWIVQANWKASDAWSRRKSAEQLDRLFHDMKIRFDDDTNHVFKRTKGVDQFLRQAEVDILGSDLNGDVHALEVAFHQAGLNYRGTRGRILKKLLRTYLMLQAFDSFGGHAHIYFVSPKVHPATATDLDGVFHLLSNEYPDVDWHLYMNQSFTSEVLRRTLAATQANSDTSELFVRAARLIDVGNDVAHHGATREPRPNPQAHVRPAPEQLQPHVRNIMRTLLEQHPALLDDEQRRCLLDPDCCKHRIGLNISNLALLRRKTDGRLVSGKARYWARVYAGSYYVCKEWWKTDHLHNARSLLSYLMVLEEAAPDGGGDVLRQLSASVSAYIEDQFATEL